MQRAIELAHLGSGWVAPNPMVGCVIVHQDKIIGEGWHQQFGAAHAEVNALMNVQEKHLLHQSTMYVTLEPCSHYGKTPPCSLAIIEHKIPKVVIGSTDPHPLVAGKGIALLKEAGIEVIEHVLEQECMLLNKRFFYFHQQQKPYVILKWAETADGFIGPELENNPLFEEQSVISNATVNLLTHRWRTEEQAIMIGTNTAIADNPQLTARHWPGKNPTRIVLDLKGRVPANHHIFNAEAPTLFITANQTSIQLQEHIQVIRIDSDKGIAEQILATLYQAQILSVIIEGGTALLQTFIDSGLWNEARVIRASHQLVKGVKAPKLIASINESFTLDNNSITIYQPA